MQKRGRFVIVKPAPAVARFGMFMRLSDWIAEHSSGIGILAALLAFIPVVFVAKAIYSNWENHKNKLWPILELLATLLVPFIALVGVWGANLSQSKAVEEIKASIQHRRVLSPEVLAKIASQLSTAPKMHVMIQSGEDGDSMRFAIQLEEMFTRCGFHASRDTTMRDGARPQCLIVSSKEPLPPQMKEVVIQIFGAIHQPPTIELIDQPSDVIRFNIFPQ